MNITHPYCSSIVQWRQWHLALFALFFLLALVPAFAQPLPNELPCNDPACATTSISVNTGANHDAGGLYPIGGTDSYWTITGDINPANGPVPRPANVVDTATGGVWSAPQTGTQWIAGTPTSTNGFIGPVRYRRCFCVCGPGTRSLSFALNIMSDDASTVFLDGVIVGSVPGLLPSPTALNFVRPLTPGVHCLEIEVTNNPAFNSGLNVQGTISGFGLLRSTCCGGAKIPTPDLPCDVQTLTMGSDGTWSIITDPSGGLVPRCASITTRQTGWGAAQPGSNWISVNPLARTDSTGFYVYQKCFCVSEQTTLQLTVSVMADDSLSVTFGGTTILSAPNWAGSIPRTVTVPITVSRGCHCIQFRVNNINGVVTGLNAVVTLTGPNLLRENCCYCASCPCQTQGSMPAPPDNHSDHAAGVESATGKASSTVLLSIPNPTTGATEFHYQIGTAADVTLELYDGAGRLVEVLEKGWKEQGNHLFTYDVRHLPAGRYHLRLRAGADTFSLPVSVQ